MWVFFILALFNSVDILLSKNCHPGLELRAWSLERGFTTQSSKLKALSNEETKSLEQGISTVVKHSLNHYEYNKMRTNLCNFMMLQRFNK